MRPHQEGVHPGPQENPTGATPHTLPQSRLDPDLQARVVRPSTFAWRVVCSCAAHTSPDTQGLPRVRQRCGGPRSWSGGSSSPRAEGAERTRGRASAGGPLSTDARRESRPPRNSPLSPEPSTAPRTEFQPLPSALLPAGGGRSPSGHRAGRGCDGAAARAARGSAVSGRESRLPCHPPVAAPFTQDPAVAPAQARAVCRRENPSWTSVQLERCGPRVRACACAHAWTRVHSSVCVLACMRVRVHVCARAALRLQAAGRPSLSPRQQARPHGAREAAGPRRGRAWRELPRRLRRPHGAAPSPQGRRTAATSPRWRPRCGRRTTRS